jgi:hypothetical protein
MTENDTQKSSKILGSVLRDHDINVKGNKQ